MSDLLKERAAKVLTDKKLKKQAETGIEDIHSILVGFEGDDSKLIKWFDENHSARMVKEGYSNMAINSRHPLLDFKDIGFSSVKWMEVVKKTSFEGWRVHGAVHSGDSAYGHRGGLHSVICLELSLTAEKNIQKLLLEKYDILFCASTRMGCKRGDGSGKIMVFRSDMTDKDTEIEDLESWYKDGTGLKETVTMLIPEQDDSLFTSLKETTVNVPIDDFHKMISENDCFIIDDGPILYNINDGLTDDRESGDKYLIDVEWEGDDSDCELQIWFSQVDRIQFNTKWAVYEIYRAGFEPVELKILETVSVMPKGYKSASATPKSVLALEVKHLPWTEKRTRERIRVKDYSSGKKTTFAYALMDDVGPTVSDIVLELMSRLGARGVGVSHNTEKCSSMLFFEDGDFDIRKLSSMYAMKAGRSND